MKPPKPEQREYEKIDTNEFVLGTIEDIMHDPTHEFKYEGQTSVKEAVRFKYSVDGYSYPHYSRWMTFSYGEKAELYKKYLTSLVENAHPWMELDIECIKGLRVKMLWKETENGYQFVETIRPADGKKVLVPGLSEAKAKAERLSKTISAPAPQAQNGKEGKKAAPAKKAAPIRGSEEMAEVVESDEVPF